ncbi:D-alanyl-D-alanine carboxypeptidase family protein [Bacillus sp. JCM 19041]|uniref:D-alanyl-D-alanine carboxypeptidase family protein n=1 Tax=Bacillus sp. JCM 19041 TaxID=1460637 RepID=UPI0006D1B31F
MRSYTFKEKVAAACVLVFVIGVLLVMENHYSLTGLDKTEGLIELNIASNHAILTRLGAEDEVLMEKASDESFYPASLTKMMTVLVAIEETNNMSEPVLLSGQLFMNLEGTNSSMAGFVPDEEVALIDLLFGAMLPSGAEASLGLAVHIAGSETAFVEEMNAKARELNLQGTHFTNATGLHDANQYTTSEDMALLLKYALNNEQFREVFTTKTHVTNPTAQHPDGITLQSSLLMRAVNTDMSGGELLGGKTGYTKEAGLCLATLAVVNGEEYILITAEADGNHHTEPYHIQDAIDVYEGVAYQL